MLTLVRIKGTSAIWLSDLIHRRWITNPTELATVRAVMQSRNIPTAVVDVPSFVGYGIPDGPNPPEVKR